jgi:hypothetical protein
MDHTPSSRSGDQADTAQAAAAPNATMTTTATATTKKTDMTGSFPEHPRGRGGNALSTATVASFLREVDERRKNVQELIAAALDALFRAWPSLALSAQAAQKKSPARSRGARYPCSRRISNTTGIIRGLPGQMQKAKQNGDVATAQAIEAALARARRIVARGAAPAVPAPRPPIPAPAEEGWAEVVVDNRRRRWR